MPRGRRYSGVFDNPYVGIDVDYFDRKALEKQQRHDKARANYSQFVQEVANQSYLDPDARQAYLNQQQTDFDAVLSKNAGNLSAGFQDILGAIEKSKLNPYHNLNRRQVEQAKTREKLMAQYGDRAIDMSNINQPLYKRDVDGNIAWSDPSAIQANVVEANDYAQIVEKMLAETAAQKFTSQTGLGGGSGNPFYLMSKITKGEVLTPEELQRIAMDPNVQQAFLANASTAGIDNRNVPGTNMTYRDMLTNPQSLGQFIYGNIQDKQRNNIHEQKQFNQNIGAKLAAQEASNKRVAAYTEDLKRQPIQLQPNIRVNLGTGVVNDKKWQQIGKDKEEVDNSIKGIADNNNRIYGELSQMMGSVPEGIFNKDMTINYSKVLETIKTNNPNLSDTEATQMLSNARANFKLLDKNKQDMKYLEQEQLFFNRIEQGVNENIVNPEYSKLYKSFDKDQKELIQNILGVSNITEKDFLKEENLNKIAETLSESSPRAGIITDIMDAFGNTSAELINKFSQTEANISDKMKNSEDVFKDLYVGLSNHDKKSATFKFQDNFNKALTQTDPLTAINTFTSPTGNPIDQHDEIVKDLVTRSKQDKDSDDYVKMLPPTVMFPSGDNLEDGNNTAYLMVNYQDKDGNKYSYPVRARSDQNSSVFREYENALLSDAYNGTFRSEEEQANAIGTAHTVKGKGLYGSNISNAIDAVERGYSYQTIPMTTYNKSGNRVRADVTITKGVDANGEDAFFIKLPTSDRPFVAKNKADAINLTSELGGRLFVNNNPKMAKNFTITDKQFYKPVFK
jgi:hypothetical protein